MRESRERNDIQRGKEFRCYVTDSHLVDVVFVLKKDRIDSPIRMIMHRLGLSVNITAIRIEIASDLQY